ncbi:hypothetical protein RIF29_41987 [Crotalaria pallida]|uniref:CMP/dCMP-type deaminase domain-containing protein n=1 Tax=Crotalaria pallida TaxID=3830 RepID=A0AAN9HPW7_CROPI
MKAQGFSISDCNLHVPIFSTNVTPPNFASFLPFHFPSKLSLTCGFSNPLLWAHRPHGWRSSNGSGCGGPGVSLMIKCGSNGDNDDGFRRCVELARKVVGFTSPNRMVGCVFVKDGNVGQGFHPKPGQPHAEIENLCLLLGMLVEEIRFSGLCSEGCRRFGRECNSICELGTLQSFWYVSLEPCNHFGRTPPCTEALIKAKVKKVVVGMVDPNPIVASKGLDRLRDAGIEVVVGVEKDLCKILDEAYIHLTGRSFLTLRTEAAPEVAQQGIETVALDQISLDAILLCRDRSSKTIEELRASKSGKFTVQGLGSEYCS